MILLAVVLALSGQIVLVKPKMVETRRPVVERFIQSVRTGQPVYQPDLVNPLGPQSAALLKPLSACKPKGYLVTFQGSVLVNWHCKRRPGTDLLATILQFEGDRIRRIELAEVDERANQP